MIKYTELKSDEEDKRISRRHKKRKSLILGIILISIVLVISTFSLSVGIDAIRDPSAEILSGHLFQEYYASLKNISLSTDPDCMKCKSKLALGKKMALTNPELIPELFTRICVEEGHDRNICYAKFHRYTVEHSYHGSDFANVLTLMDPMGYDGIYMCHFFEHACELPPTPKFDLKHLWPVKKPEYTQSPEGSGRTFNIIHLSDIHIQRDFSVGYEANCSDSMCCTSHSRNSEPIPEGYNISQFFREEQLSNLSFYSPYYDSKDMYQKGDNWDFFGQGEPTVWRPTFSYGDYVCDAPEVLINNSLRIMMNIEKEESLDFEFAIFTGDLIDHEEMQYISLNYTLESEEIVFRDMKHHLGDIPVYSVLGNHDTFPYGSMAQRDSGFTNIFDWNFETMSGLWQDYGWIDQSSADYASSHYTGYSITTRRGLKIIALNSNTWYAQNVYNFWGTDKFDTYGQFQFLIDELVESEKEGQRVWIIAHVPASNLITLPPSTVVFKDIIERFSPYTIAAVFYGHTHLDQFQILYAGEGEESSKVIDNVVNMAWISQSITPFANRNPSWRYYEVDDESFSIMNSFNYFTKLNDTFTNGGDEPIWEVEYSAREAYDPEGTFPKDHPLNATFWHHVAEKIKSNATYNQLYTDYQFRLSPFSPKCESATECETNYCYITSFSFDQFAACYNPEFGVFD